MAGNLLATTLYRAVLRTARRIDADCATRALLSSPLIRAEKSPSSSPLPHDVAEPLAQKWLDGLSQELHDDASPSSLMRSAAAVKSPVNLRDALSRHIRADLDNGSIGDAGFSLLRYLSETHALGERLFDASTASATPAVTTTTTTDVRAGHYLVADPFAYNPCQQRILEWVYACTPMVLLVLEQEEGMGGQTSAVVINAPTSLRLRRHDWMHALEVPDGGVFECCHVYYGGGDQSTKLTMLHTHGEELSGSKAIGQTGLYEGGLLQDAAHLVRMGRASPADFLFYRGRVELPTTRVTQEVQRGEWMGCVAEWDGGGKRLPVWARPESNAPGMLAEEAQRLDASWASWSQLVSGMADKSSASGLEQMLRITPEVMKGIMIRAAHLPPPTAEHGSEDEAAANRLLRSPASSYSSDHNE